MLAALVLGAGGPARSPWPLSPANELRLPAAAPAPAPARDDTGWLQGRLDAGGGEIRLPKLPNGECYATRGLWVSHDDTQIVSNGACIQALGPGPVRLTSPDGDPIPASAVFFVNRSQPLDPAPARIRISGLHIVIPAGVASFGLGIFGHEVTVQNVEVSGSPVDDVIVGGRANGDGYAGPVTLLGCRLSGGMRNLVSATGVIGLRIERTRLTGATDTYPTASGNASGNPAAGIDLEPDVRGAPILDVRIANDVISGNAGPGILLELSTNRGLPITATRIQIAGNRIVSNGRRTTPPQQGGIVFAGGQDGGGGRVTVTRNVIRGNRGAGLQGHELALTVDARGNDLGGNSGGPYDSMRFTRSSRVG